jgi:hypothetical protein
MKSELQPKAYYELYMAIFNELNQFRVHLSQMFPMAPPSSSASEVVNEGNAEQQGVTDSNENVSKLDSKGLPSTSHQMPDNELNCISTGAL